MTKIFILISVFSIIELCQGYHQSDYHINYKDVILHTYNHSALRNPVVKVGPYNSTVPILINLSGNLLYHYTGAYVGVKPYKLVRNIYRDFPFPQLDIDVCDEMANNRLGTKEVIEHANLKSCPSDPGFYYLKDYILEENKFPPHIPVGVYKLYLDIRLNDGIFLANATCFGSITKASKKKNS